MRSSAYRDFAVVAFSEQRVRGCRFRTEGGAIRLSASAVELLDPTDPVQAWKKVLKSLSYHRNMPLFLSGALNRGIFFRCFSARLAPKALRSALEFELPTHLLKEPEQCNFQFLQQTEPESPDGFPVNVYAFPEQSLERVAAMITQSGSRADYFLYPLMNIKEKDPPVFLPEFEPGFCFMEGEWHPAEELEGIDWLDGWRKKWDGLFRMPAEKEFPLEEYFVCFLVASLVTSEEFRAVKSGLNILPKQLRPSRLKLQISIFVFLVVLLAVNSFWSSCSAMGKKRREYRAVLSERNALLTKVRTSQIRLKSSEKETRDFLRVVSMRPGEHDVLGELADFSEALPGNVMVNNIRWSENSVDLVMRSEAENLNIQQILRSPKNWKLGQIQQRRRGNGSSSMVTLKLIPADEGDRK